MTTATAKKAQHTPGPWSVGVHYETGELGIIGDTRGIATVLGERGVVMPIPEATARANANLMAAAPDMLDALKAILEDLDDRYDGLEDSKTLWMGPHIDRIRSVIATVQIATVH